MKTPGFLRELVVALVLSVAGAVVYGALSRVAGSPAAIRIAIVVVGAVYVMLFLRDVRARIGHVVVAAALVAMDIGWFAFDPPRTVWLLAHGLAIWLVRCLYLHDGVLGALADGVIGAFALAAATVTIAHTHSVFLALWSFLLVQASFVLIPRHADDRNRAACANDADGFDSAFRSAEAALRRLTARS
jgi:hypothetical protein